MKATRGRDSAPSGTAAIQARYVGWVCLAILLAMLAACRSEQKTARPTAPREPSTIVVSTVEPTKASSTKVPTPLPPTVTPTPTPPAPLAALVNGQYIFLADYERQLALYEQSLTDLGIDQDSSQGQVLEDMIDRVIIDQEAANRDLTLSEQELAAQVATDIESGGGQAAFEEWLTSAGLTQKDYERMLRDSLVLQRVWDAITADVPAEMDQVHARHIVVGSQEEAQQIKAQLHEGADFVALAREQSLDTATKDNGGDLGWFPRGMVAVEIETAAFALQPGETSDGVQVGGEYHVIQVVEREAARPLESVLLMQFQQARFDRWLENQRAAAEIERFVGD